MGGKYRIDERVECTYLHSLIDSICAWLHKNSIDETHIITRSNTGRQRCVSFEFRHRVEARVLALAWTHSHLYRRWTVCIWPERVRSKFPIVSGLKLQGRIKAVAWRLADFWDKGNWTWNVRSLLVLLMRTQCSFFPSPPIELELWWMDTDRLSPLTLSVRSMFAVYRTRMLAFSNTSKSDEWDRHTQNEHI